jgi:hypothetical protein
MPISNRGGAAEIVGTFDFDIGPQASGEHQIYVSFTGGTTCAINYIFNETPSCPIDEEDPDINFMPSMGWPLYSSVGPTYTVNPPVYPVMTVTPDPTLDFGDVNVTTDRSFSIKNTGGEMLSGQVTGVFAPFYCEPNCLYSVLPGDSTTLKIRFAPASQQSYSASVSFSCIGATRACQPLLAYPRTITANYTSTVQPPQVSLCATPPCSVDFGNMSVGAASTTLVTVTNSGDGKIDGAVTFSSSEYQCIGPCDYRLFGGESTTIQIWFTPTVIGVHSDTATFTGGVSQTLSMTSTVSDKPILSVNSRNPTDPIFTASFGTVVSGVCKNYTMTVRNIGAGLLSNKGLPITGTPDAVGSSTLAVPYPPGFSCIVNCTYDGLATTSTKWTTIQYCATGAYADNSVHSTTAEFKNTQGASVFVTLTAQSNSSPTAGFSGATDGNTGFFILNYVLPTLDYGNVLINTTKTLTVTLKNTGAGLLSGTMGAAATEPAFTCISQETLPSAVISACSVPYSIPNDGSSVTFTFGFTPTLQKSYFGTIDMGSVASGDTLEFRGRGEMQNFEFETDLNPSQQNTVFRDPAFSPSLAITSLETTNDASSLFHKIMYPSGGAHNSIIYINSDQNITTGYEATMGADYLAKGGSFYRFMGSSQTDWTWKCCQYITYSNPSGTEFNSSILRSLIGYPRFVTEIADREYPMWEDSRTTTLTHTFSQSLAPFNSPANSFDFGTTLYGSATQNKQINFLALNRTRVGTVSYAIDMSAAPNFRCLGDCAGGFPNSDTGRYNYGVFTNSVTCSNSRFGDPAPSSLKHCDYRPVGSSANWTFCANEGNQCNFAGTMNVRYGVDDAYSGYQAYPVLEFRPLAEGDYIEPITVNYNLNDGTGPMSLIFYAHGNSNPTGIGFPVPLIRLVPDAYLDMGIVSQGARRDKDVTIYNDGLRPLNVVSIRASVVGNPLILSTHFSCIADAYTAPDNCNPTIAPGESRVIKVTFRPQTGSGGLDADLNFTSDAFNIPTPPINLHGEAEFSSVVTILLQGSDFGRVPIGKSKSQNVTIRNTGTGDFGSGTITITGPFRCVSSEYGLDAFGNCKYTLNSNGSTTITIEFSPLTKGQHIGAMELSGLPGVSLPPMVGTGVSPYIKFFEI